MRGGKREGAGRKPGSVKDEARRAVVRVRLSDDERAEAVRCAKEVGESESEFIRGAIAIRCTAAVEAKRLKAKAKEMEVEAPYHSARIQGMAEVYEKLAKTR